MRRLGVMPYMTPLQRATESSITPKSVMKTTVGGCTVVGAVVAATEGCARRGVARKSKRAKHQPSARVDFAAEVNVVCIKSGIDCCIKSNPPRERVWLHRSARG